MTTGNTGIYQQGSLFIPVASVLAALFLCTQVRLTPITNKIPALGHTGDILYV